MVLGRETMFSVPVVGTHCHETVEIVRPVKTQEAWAITVESDSVYEIQTQIEFGVLTCLLHTSYRHNSICGDRI